MADKKNSDVMLQTHEISALTLMTLSSVLEDISEGSQVSQSHVLRTNKLAKGLSPALRDVLPMLVLSEIQGVKEEILKSLGGREKVEAEVKGMHALINLDERPSDM